MEELIFQRAESMFCAFLIQISVKNDRQSQEIVFVKRCDHTLRITFWKSLILKDSLKKYKSADSPLKRYSNEYWITATQLTIVAENKSNQKNQKEERTIPVK